MATKKTTNLVAVADQSLGEKPTTGALGKLARKRKTALVPVHDDPRAELRRLVMEHKAMTRLAVQTISPTQDKKSRETGATIKSLVPDDVKAVAKGLADAYKRRAASLESAMMRELRKLDIYRLFLSHVFGAGPVVSAYLVAMVNFDRCEKPSALKRYCGMAVINGRLERPTRGMKLGYNAELRTRLYQMMSSVWKNAAKKSADRPNGSTSKYLDVWTNYKHRMQHSERYRAATNELLYGETWRKGAKAAIHSGGWHKAADVFLEDLYIVGRALAGLPVWPSYYAAKLGYEHGGKISVNAPKLLTVEEALALVGDVGAQPALAPVADVDTDEIGDDEAEMAADVLAAE